MKHQRIPTREKAGEPNIFSPEAHPAPTRWQSEQRARYARMIDTAMRTQRPQLKEIG